MQKLATVLLCLFFGLGCYAQEIGDTVKKLPSVALGFKFRFTYSPNPWRYIQFRNVPQSLRTVPDESDPWEIVPQQDVKLHEDSFLTFDFGFLVNVKDRLEFSLGPSLGYAATTSALAEYESNGGFYQINGSGKSWFPGGFAETNLRIRGPVWLTMNVSSYPRFDDLAFSRGQGHGEQNFNQPGFAARYFNGFTIGKFRYPFMALAGVRICPFAEKDEKGKSCFTVMAGPAFREVSLLPAALGIQANHNQPIFIIRVGLEITSR